MKLLDTIPITVAPTYLMVLFILSSLMLAFAIIAHKWDKSPLLALIGLIIFVVVITLGNFKIGFVYDHDEYVVSLNEVTAVNFFKEYEIVKTYEYSDAVRVRKKDGVK